MGSIEDLVSDTSQHVRAALGTQISGLAPILGKDECVALMIDIENSDADLMQDYCTFTAHVFANVERRIPRCPITHNFEIRVGQQRQVKSCRTLMLRR